MIRPKDKQTSFFEDVIYDRVFAGKQHWLFDLDQVVEFNAFRPILEEPYSEGMGRPTDPVMLFKIVFLQFVADLSDRKIEEAVQYNLLYKKFVGLAADASSPDYSTISKFRTRLGAERFERIFNQIVDMARDEGVINDRLRLIDATHIRARVDLFGPHQRKQDRSENKDKPDGGSATLSGSPDPDAAFGKKSDTKPFYGYKAHIGVDDENAMITDIRTTPGNWDDGHQFPFLINNYPPEAVTANKGYDYNNNHNHCAAKEIEDGIILKKNRKNRQQPSRSLTSKRKKVERVFAEMKQWHHLGQSRWWGLDKMCIQSCLTALVYNCKRLVKLKQDEKLCPVLA